MTMTHKEDIATVPAPDFPTKVAAWRMERAATLAWESAVYDPVHTRLVSAEISSGENSPEAPELRAQIALLAKESDERWGRVNSLFLDAMAHPADNIGLLADKLELLAEIDDDPRYYIDGIIADIRLLAGRPSSTGEGKL